MSALINAHDAAKKLGYRTTKALHSAVQRHGIPHVRIGHVLRFDPDELDRFIDTLKRRRNSRIRIAG